MAYYEDRGPVYHIPAAGRGGLVQHPRPAARWRDHGGLMQIDIGSLNIAVAQYKMAFQLAETKGNIWMRE